MTIYEKISTIRAIKGIKQDIMADAVNVTQGAYSNLEAGKSKLTFEALEKIAEAFNMPIIDIITYPKVYVDRDTIQTAEIIPTPSENDNEVKAILQLELKKDKKDQVLKLIFGETNLEILNK
ncbi:MAG: helix-turn-helix transcriptional regulator [Bacteroidales bacterium]|nr:helix-turn-helix transcriptional regulator [Bacteroidales bacterium]